MANTGIYESDFDDAASLRAGDDDSDLESLTDAQSPTDGYFEQRNIPRQTFVENPANSPPKAKEAEAEADRARMPAPFQSHSQSQSQPPQPLRSIDDAVTPLLDAGPAPPDYASATAGQREQQRAAFNSEHPLVRNGLLHEHGVFNAREGPQSMRDPIITPTQLPVGPGGFPDDRDQAQIEEQPTERTGLLSGSGTRRSKTKRHSDSSRSRGLKGCIATVIAVLLIVLAILVATKANLSGASPDQRHNPTFNPGLPPKGPTPSHPANSNGVPLDRYSPTQSFEFSGNNKFELLELIDYDQYRRWFPRGVRIDGTVQISPAAKGESDDETPDIQVWVNIATNSPIAIPEIGYIQTADTLEIRFPTPELNGWQLADNAYFDIAIAVHVREGVSLDTFDVSTANLHVNVDEGLFQTSSDAAANFDSGLTIRESSRLHTTHGRIAVKYWDSRQTVIETTSGRIEGSFALRDLLRLQSTSGSISAIVDPKDDADAKHPVPAEFIMKSTSGNVHAEFPGAGPETFGSSLSSSASPSTNLYKDDDDLSIPDRDYITRVETTSGRIEGGYLLGREAKFATRSAGIVIGVRPYSTALQTSTLWTENNSGRTELQVLEAYTSTSTSTTASKHRPGVLDQLKSRHTSTSGAIELLYPQSWEGFIDAASTSGGINLRGRDVERCSTGSRDWDRDRDRWSPWTTAAQGRGGADSSSAFYLKHVTAHKGDGSSEVKMRTVSGRIEALFGADGGRGCSRS